MDARASFQQAVEKRPSAAFPSSFAVQRIPGTRSDPFGLPEHVPDASRLRQYASRLRISGALHLGIFEQPAKEPFSTGS